MLEGRQGASQRWERAQEKADADSCREKQQVDNKSRWKATFGAHRARPVCAAAGVFMCSDSLVCSSSSSLGEHRYHRIREQLMSLQLYVLTLNLRAFIPPNFSLVLSDTVRYAVQKLQTGTVSGSDAPLLR